MDFNILAIGIYILTNGFILEVPGTSGVYRRNRMDRRILEDMVTLCNGVIKNFTPEEWDEMSQEDKMKWCEDFGLEHAHIIEED